MTTTTVKVNVYDDQGSLVEVADVDVQDVSDFVGFVDQWASERDLDTLQGGSDLFLAYPDTLEFLREKDIAKSCFGDMTFKIGELEYSVAEHFEDIDKIAYKQDMIVYIDMMERDGEFVGGDLTEHAGRWFNFVAFRRWR